MNRAPLIEARAPRPMSELDRHELVITLVRRWDDLDAGETLTDLLIEAEPECLDRFLQSFGVGHTQGTTTVSPVTRVMSISTAPHLTAWS